MKKIINLLFYLILSLCVYSQKMPSDYFEEGIDFMENDNTPKALESFKHIVENHPKNDLYPRSFYNLGYVYYQDKDYHKAKLIFKSILESQFNEKEALGGNIMADPYTNYRHRASSLLHAIYYETEKYDSALHYLALSDTVYPFQHFCGNAYAEQDIYMSLKYSDLYEKLNDLTNAKTELFNSIFYNGLADNTEVLDKLKELYQQEKNHKKIKKQLDKSLQKIYSKTLTSSDNETYTWYYFKFQDIEVPLTYSFFDSENFNEKETINKIKESAFYKMIQSL